MAIKVKRVYDPPSPDDGYRVLVDRLWPRGLSAEAAHVDLWMQDVAPTTELRAWYGDEVGRWPEFRERYEKEPAEHGELLDLVLDRDPRIHLLVGSRRAEGTQEPGQGCLLEDIGTIIASGEEADRVKAEFRRARGALVARVEKVSAQP